jgi:hypothetical protein
MSSALGDVLRRAVRPAQELVPAAAEAVLFADQAELLACLASDLCGGQAYERWWWRGLYRGGDLERVLVDAWLEAPALVPGGFVLLARRGQVAQLVRRIAKNDAERLTSAVAVTFGLMEIARLLQQGRSVSESGATPTVRDDFVSNHSSDVLSPSEPVRSASHAHPQIEPPWQQWAPESNDASLIPAQRMLVGISLLLSRAASVGRTPKFEAAFAAWHSGEPRPPDAIEVQSILEWPHRLSPRPSPVDHSEVIQNDTSSLEHVTSTSVAHNGVRYGVTESPPLIGNPDTEPTLCIAANLVDSLVLESTSIQTQLGGIFYLVNLAIALELYGDFTQPANPSFPLGIWDFLTLVARRLLGRRRHPKDPIWSLLASLAGRKRRERPGANFLAPDAPHRWVNEVVPSIRERLKWHHVGAHELLAHPARVVVTPVHLDIYLSLTDLPMAIRISGLDRDPGWVPAAGRSLAFHFD